MPKPTVGEDATARRNATARTRDRKFEPYSKNTKTTLIYEATSGADLAYDRQ